MVFIKATAISPVNIATIKYWGKRNEELILPLNDSISVTLNTEQMHAKTTVIASPDFKSDRIWLNGVEESIENPRLQSCLKSIRKLAKEQIKDNPAVSWKLHICSINNFPTAAGLASSAAGYSCLVYTLSRLFKLEGDITTIARQGSGSACRSIFGGFVQWFAGVKPDGSDSVARQLKPASFWPDLHVLILVVNDGKKSVSSTIGMRRTAETSKFLKYRVETSVEEHITQMTRAINEKDFHLFSEITIKDSNQFHAVCLDTYPPTVYMNDTSHLIASFVHNYNSQFNYNKIAYTFDAGPNACLFTLEKDVDVVTDALVKSFPPQENVDVVNYIKGIPFNIRDVVTQELTNVRNKSGLLKYVIHTTIGDGPKLLPDEFDLLTDDGIPKSTELL